MSQEPEAITEMRGAHEKYVLCLNSDRMRSVVVYVDALQAEIARLTAERDTNILALRTIEASLGTLDHSEAIDDEQQLPEYIARKVGKLVPLCDTLKRENAALVLDKARLDWLESRKTEVHFWNNNGNGKCSFIENWDAPEAADALLEAPTLRDAIDAAKEPR